VLLALRNDAKYWKDGQVCEIPGPKLMDSAVPWFIYPAFAFVGYPNRDSTPYTERYKIPECKNLIRGTLRYQGFPQFVKVLVALGLLSEEPVEYLQHSAPEIAWVFYG
jgi:saccharopine dehydrogenase (NADP+, L-glutamate forming)